MATDTIKEEVRLYNGKVSITFYPTSHQYRLNGKVIPSVTTVIGLIDKSRQLLIWAENLARDYFKANAGCINLEIAEQAITQYKYIRDTTAQQGKDIHSICEMFVRHILFNEPEPNLDNLEPETINGFSAFLKWYNANDVEFLQTEKLVYSRKYNYCGTLDLIAKVNNITLLCDIKSGKDIYPNFWIQLAAYKNAYLEEHKKETIDGFAILHFDKITSDFTVYERGLDKEKDSFKQFLNLLALRTYLAENK